MMCKVEHVNKELEDPAKEISRQPVEGTIWLLLAIYKMEEERQKLREELFSRAEVGVESPPLELVYHFKN